MTFTELMGLSNGNYIETAGTSAKNQCVDLVNAYIRYVLGLPIIEWTNAVDFPSKAGDKYEYILNTPTGIPKEGDLVVWSGQYGHIAIFIEGNANRFTSFDENYPVGSPCHAQEHNYNNVLGWLHCKAIKETIPVLKTDFENLVSKATKLDEQKPPYDQIKQLLTETQNDLAGTKTALASENKFHEELAIALDVANQQSAILGAVAKFVTIEDDLRNRIKELADAREVIKSQEAEIIKMAQANKELSKLNTDMHDYYDKLQNQFEKLKIDYEILKSEREKLGKYTAIELITELINRLFHKT